MVKAEHPETPKKSVTPKKQRKREKKVQVKQEQNSDEVEIKHEEQDFSKMESMMKELINNKIKAEPKSGSKKLP